MVYLVLKFKSAIDITTKMQYILTKVKYFNIVKIRGMMKLTKKNGHEKRLLKLANILFMKKDMKLLPHGT